MKPLTKQQAEDKGYTVETYDNGDYKYGNYKYEADRTQFLIQKKKAIERGEFRWFLYTCASKHTLDGIQHLIRNGKEIAKGDYVFSFNSGYYGYEIEGIFRRFNKDHKEITI